MPETVFFTAPDFCLSSSAFAVYFSSSAFCLPASSSIRLIFASSSAAAAVSSSAVFFVRRSSSSSDLFMFCSMVNICPLFMLMRLPTSLMSFAIIS